MGGRVEEVFEHEPASSSRQSKTEIKNAGIDRNYTLAPLACTAKIINWRTGLDFR